MLFFKSSNTINLSKSEKKIFSQFGEDGVIQKIFEVIEPESKFAVEFGAGDGIKFSNIRNLLVNQDWSGLYIEGNEEEAKALFQNYKDYPRIKTVYSKVYPGNIETIFEDNHVPTNLDLLSIDIDGNDYYVWKVIHNFRPKVVLIEFNASFPPPQKMVVDYHPLNYWDCSDYYGASIQSLYELGKKKNYELVYCTKDGVNLFFVDKPYYNRFGIQDNSPIALYHPPKFGLKSGGRAPNGRGWPPFESYTVKKKGKVIKPYNKPLCHENILIQKKFRHDI